MRGVLAIAGVLLVLFGALPASADQSKQLDAIRKRMEDGLALFVAGKAKEAASQFEAGYTEHPYSAFLFNAGVCYEKLGRDADALAKYRQYIEVDPEAPDIADVQQRVERLNAKLSPAEPGPDGVAEPPPTARAGELGQESMRSLVVIETEPPGAPVRVFRPVSDPPIPFQSGGASHPGWTEIVTTTAPTSLSLSVGLYHIVVDKYQDFNASDTQLRVAAGHVHHFKANLSQGVFMAFLRVSSNVKGAHIWLDEVDKAKPEWGTTPYGELVPVGEHEIFVEAPGFKPTSTKVELTSGERREVQVEMSRVDYGFVRVDAMDAAEAWVSLDGQPKGRWIKGGKPLDVEASAGKHRLLVEVDGRKDFEGTVEIPPGQVLPVHVRMIPKYPRGTAWAQAGISAGLIGASIYFGVESENIKEELQADRRAGTLDGEDPRITKGRWYAIGADAGFAAGGLLAALATWNFIKDPLPESSLTQDEPAEFDDPLARPPQGGPAPLSSRFEEPRARVLYPGQRSTFTFSPTAGQDFAGLLLGGTF